MRFVIYSIALLCVCDHPTLSKKKHHCEAGTKWKHSCYSCECTDEGVERCSFDLNDDTPKKPLILKNQGDPELLYPEEYSVIKVSKDKKLKLTCLDKRFTKLNVKTIVATCLEDGMVQVRGHRKMKLSELECEKFPSSVLRKTNRTCHNNFSEYEVGYQVNKKFLNTIHICFDDIEKRALYSWYNSSKVHTGHQTNVDRPQFVDDNLYDFNVNKAYFRKEQINSLAKLLKSKTLAEKYIKKGGGMYYLARGHLTPKADFVYGSEQASSFHYANAAPQWQIFNEGNWNRLEANVRKLLQEHPRRYEVLTGTYGVATLPDVNRKQQKLYLYVDSDEKKLPIPKLFWKVIYDTEVKKGVAVVGVNNPYLEDIPSDYVMCEDICNEIDWFEVNTSNVDHGYLYCCKMNEFFKVTGYKNLFQPDETSTEEPIEQEETEEEEEEESDSESTDSILQESCDYSDYSEEAPNGMPYFFRTSSEISIEVPVEISQHVEVYKK